MIHAHKSLEPVLSQKSTNPKTGQIIEIELPSPSTTASIVLKGVEGGIVYLEMEAPPVLYVTANEEFVEDVIKVAKQIATKLGASFVAEGIPY